ncbi:unnamed protein product [Linum trigynum]|uniref:Uncharacterized protein n=1 Tax=Linum trigynum TaxID=586398 RepID=A0AAV2CY80_9ROSI
MLSITASLSPPTNSPHPGLASLSLPSNTDPSLSSSHLCSPQFEPPNSIYSPFPLDFPTYIEPDFQTSQQRMGEQVVDFTLSSPPFDFESLASCSQILGELFKLRIEDGKSNELVVEHVQRYASLTYERRKKAHKSNTEMEIHRLGPLVNSIQGREAGG